VKDEQQEIDLVLKRVAKRTAFGTLFGAIAGMILQPPFKGITTTSSDVQGLTYVSWPVTALIGMIFGLISGLINTKNFRKRQEDKTGGSNQAL